MGDGSCEMDWRYEIGNARWEMGDGRREIGNGSWELGDD